MSGNRRAALLHASPRHHGQVKRLRVAWVLWLLIILLCCCRCYRTVVFRHWVVVDVYVYAVGFAISIAVVVFSSLGSC